MELHPPAENRKRTAFAACSITWLNTTAGFLLLRGGALHHAASLASAETGSERTPTGSSHVVEIRTTPH